MKIRIKLQNNREIETEIGEKEYEELKRDLIRGQIKFLNFENQFIKTSLINSIEPIAEPIPEEFRLPERQFGEETEKRIEVPAGWQLPSARERMTKLFNQIKANGCFKQFRTYEDWEKEKYASKG
jgi:hypothetical protein